MNRVAQLFWKGRRRWITTITVVVLAFAMGMVAYLDSQHSFELKTETFTFESGGNELSARLHLPTAPGPHGLVVFIPGDGPARYDPGILPVWEALARAGYATVQWNKPGVGDSTGDWLDQDMKNRAAEVTDAIAALDQHEDIDTGDLGVIGVSQGGWVIPIVAQRGDVDFFVAWSTAIDWTEQGDYLTERLIADETPELAERVRNANRDDRGDSYQDYLDWYGSLDDDVAEFFSEMSEKRWRFAVRNEGLDARDNLESMRGTPVLLLLGDRDDNVDVDDTERVYRDILGGPCLEVMRYPHGDHQLLDRHGLSLTLTGIFAPRAVFADTMLNDIERFTRGPRGCMQR